MRSSIGILLLIIFFYACKGDRIGTDEFILKPGFSIELVAAEPLVQAPVAMDFDEEGNIWVIELPGYMRDIDGGNEDFPDGKLVRLIDSNKDGVMDVREVVVDSLIAPRAVACVYQGILYTDGIQLIWRSLDGDQSDVVDSFYVTGSNIEHQPNGLLYHIDNWIYSARSNTRYKRQNGKWIKDLTSFRGQWGISSDDAGRLIYNDNSNLVRGDALLPNHFIENKYLEVNNGIGRRLTSDNKVYPFQATSVNRGYQEGVLNEAGLLHTTTSACGPVIYKGENFPADCYGDAFVCIPEINAVKQLGIKRENGRLTAHHIYEDLEFLVSRDETFRPVSLYNGPDGALYIVDLRKGIIQHRAYMTDYLRENILKKGLDEVVGKGRIYKVQYGEISGSSINKDIASDQDFIDGLRHRSGYIRVEMQKKIIFEDRKVLEEALRQMTSDPDYPMGAIHAMWTLEGLGLLDIDFLKMVIRGSDYPTVINHALHLLEELDGSAIDRELLEGVLSINSQESAIMVALLAG